MIAVQALGHKTAAWRVLQQAETVQPGDHLGTAQRLGLQLDLGVWRGWKDISG